VCSLLSGPAPKWQIWQVKCQKQSTWIALIKPIEFWTYSIELCPIDSLWNDCNSTEQRHQWLNEPEWLIALNHIHALIMLIILINQWVHAELLFLGLFSLLTLKMDVYCNFFLFSLSWIRLVVSIGQLIFFYKFLIYWIIHWNQFAHWKAFHKYTPSCCYLGQIWL
jgi:hypothetical protein